MKKRTKGLVIMGIILLAVLPGLEYWYMMMTSPLTYYDIDGNTITIDVRSKATEIDLTDRNVKRLDYTTFSQFTNLERLYLSMNSLEEMMDLSIFEDLEKIHLSDNHIETIHGIANLSNLEELYLSDNYISEIQGLTGLPSLQTLSLKNNQITSINGLDDLSALKNLYIAGNPLNPEECEEAFQRYSWINIIGCD